MQTMTQNEIERTIHKMDNGRWIYAEWSERNGQWQSDDITESYYPGPEYRYTVAGSLEALARRGIHTYATREDAIYAIEHADEFDDDDEFDDNE